MGDPITTIPPFSNSDVLPPCATLCGPLFDANGACVPPGGPTTNAAGYTACFCSNNLLSPFSTGVAGVCDGACPAGGVELSSIAAWFQDICSVGNGDGGNGGGNNGGDGNGGGGQTTTSGGGSTGGSSGSDSEGGGDWLSNHWQWVIMLVILVVGITGIWVGACIWRRRYLKKKDRQSFISQKHSGSATHPSWGPTPAGADASNSPDIYAHDSQAQGVFMPGAASMHDEKSRKGKKKWAVSERT